jgi:methionyl-tRNA formyltransferase
MRLVFMGTPEFAVPSLKKLAESGHTLAGIVTQPDRPKGRGQRIGFSAVRRFAMEAGLPVLQPDNLRDPAFLQSLKDWKADCFVVVAYRVLPREVFEMPPKGTVNLHASLLPRYRGAAPIQWAVIRGEMETGVSTFFIEEKVDTGAWILQEKTDIQPDETAGELHDRLALIGAGCLLRTVDLISDGKAVGTPQNGEATPAPKILPEHCRIDWRKPAAEIANLIRGLSPRPGAFTFWNGKRLKMLRAGLFSGESESASPGTVVRVDAEDLCVATGEGFVLIRTVQLECGQAMDMCSFLRGHCIVPGSGFVSSLKA